MNKHLLLVFLSLVACGDDDVANDVGTDVSTEDANTSDDAPASLDTSNDTPSDTSELDAVDAPSSDAAPRPLGILTNLDSSGQLDERPGVFAFPGATGHGRNSEGGRGGAVFCVNTLDDVNNDGDGLISYREAVSGINEADASPRIVTFCVAGELNTGSERVLITSGRLTVACQSAPSPGVVITGYRPVDLDNDSDHHIWRHCDVKPRDTLQASRNTSQRNVTIGGGRGVAPDDLIFDHMSLMYSTDDSFSVYVNSTTETSVPSRITLSHSIVADGDTTCRRSDNECGNSARNQTGDYRWPNHAMGPFFVSDNGTPVRGVSLIANLMGNLNDRVPAFRGVAPGEIANNLIFNVHSVAVNMWGPNNAAYIEGNTLKEGPDDRGTDHFRINEGSVADGNVRIDNEGTVTSTNYAGTTVRELAAGPREYLTGENELNLACVGASMPLRDSEDARVVMEVNGTGTDPVLFEAEVGVGPRVPPMVPPCTAGLRCFYEPGEGDQGQRDYSSYAEEAEHAVDYDTDEDGIADGWERALIALDDADGIETLEDIDHTTDADGDGYLDVEEWLNGLARCPI